MSGGDIAALVERVSVITRAARCGHHFDKECHTCNAAQEWTNGNMDDMRTTITDLQARLEAERAENAKLREAIQNPPQHRYWGAGEPDCPREIKAGNGELHTLRCKVCGTDSPRSPICFAAVQGMIDGA